MTYKMNIQIMFMNMYSLVMLNCWTTNILYTWLKDEFLYFIYLNKSIIITQQLLYDI